MNQMLLALDRCIESRHHFYCAAASAPRINEVPDTEPSIDDNLSSRFYGSTKTGRCPSFRTCGLSLSPNLWLSIKNIDFEGASAQPGHHWSNWQWEIDINAIDPRDFMTQPLVKGIVDGQDVRKWPLKQLRQKIAMGSSNGGSVHWYDS